MGSTPYIRSDLSIGASHTSRAANAMHELKAASVLEPGALSRTERLIFRSAENLEKLVAIYDEKLAQWPVPFDAFFVKTRYGKTHVIGSGAQTSPPLVLTHPAGCGSFVWSSIIAALSQHHRTYALDTIGELGRSRLDDCDRYSKTGRNYSAWLDDLYSELGLTASDMVAGPMGGWIALNHAIVAPERVCKLVLLGPMGLPTRRSTVGVLLPILSLVLHPTDAKLKKMIRRCLGDGERVNRELSPWTEIAFRCRARTGQPLHIPAAKLALIKSPTLVFLGGRDGLIGSATAAAHRVRNIPNCEIEILPGAGHIMNVDEPGVHRRAKRRVPRRLRATASGLEHASLGVGPRRAAYASFHREVTGLQEQELNPCAPAWTPAGRRGRATAHDQQVRRSCSHRGRSISAAVSSSPFARKAARARPSLRCGVSAITISSHIRSQEFPRLIAPARVARRPPRQWAALCLGGEGEDSSLQVCE